MKILESEETSRNLKYDIIHLHYDKTCIFDRNLINGKEKKGFNNRKVEAEIPVCLLVDSPY